MGKNQVRTSDVIFTIHMLYYQLDYTGQSLDGGDSYSHCCPGQVGEGKGAGGVPLRIHSTLHTVSPGTTRKLHSLLLQRKRQGREGRAGQGEVPKRSQVWCAITYFTFAKSSNSHNCSTTTRKIKLMCFSLLLILQMVAHTEHVERVDTFLVHAMNSLNLIYTVKLEKNVSLFPDMFHFYLI